MFLIPQPCEHRTASLSPLSKLENAECRLTGQGPGVGGGGDTQLSLPVSPGLGFPPAPGLPGQGSSGLAGVGSSSDSAMCQPCDLRQVTLQPRRIIAGPSLEGRCRIESDGEQGAWPRAQPREKALEDFESRAGGSAYLSPSSPWSSSTRGEDEGPGPR